jgi:histidinol-phosphate phosphatase family protein
MEHRLIMFDADGTLRYCTVEGQPCPNSSEEWELYPGVREKLAGYSWGAPGSRGTGYGIASNQGGVGVGYFTLETARTLLEDTFQAAFGFPAAEGTIELCPHVPRSGCPCRKPMPMMLLNVIERYGVHPGEALYVGDMENDRLAAENAGCDFMWAWEFFGREPDLQDPR